MKNIFLVLVISLFGFFANAQETAKNKNAKVEFQVKGNCGMCKKRIEKAALSVSGVKLAKWQKDTGILSLIFNEEKTNVLIVQKAIAKVGHETDGAKVSQEDYNKLHTCCQYSR